MTDQLPAVPEEITWPAPFAAVPGPAPAKRSRLQRAYLGDPGDPRWARPALLAILALSAALYLWNLTANGYANEFYAAAVQSGTKSWSAMFFGSIDTGNFITVDKPPFALWVMEVSTRVFGFSSFAMLAPIALCGVAAVGVLYSAIRRTFGHAAAAVAALVMALTPITVAINRDNNPDPVLVLLMTLGAWFTLEALRTKRLRPLLWAAVMLGCAFNTKMLQAYIVLPALVLVYLFAADGGFWKRTRHLTIFTGVLAVASFWWMLIVDAIPASSRPYIGGSSTNSVWDLVIGYNGLGRITGNELGNGFGGGGGGASFSGTSGFGRLFNDILGTQISWLLPAAAILGVAALVLRGKAPRTDPVRASLLLWGLWLGVHFVVFSYQQGTMHPYYVTTLSPAIGALVGGGGAVVWERMHERNWAWLVIPAAVAISALWSIALLHRTSYATWLVPLIAIAAIVAIGALVAVRLRPRQRARFGAVGLAALLFAGLAGPTAFAAAAANSTVNGTNPLAGPSNGLMGGPGGGFGGRGGGADGFGRGGFGAQAGPGGQAGELPSFGGGSGSGSGGGQGGFPGGFPGGLAGDLPGFPSGGAGGGGTGGTGGFPGGGPGGAQLSSAMISYLEENQGSAKWLLAVANSNSAASLELQTGRSVISMWGFTGSDPAMTAAKLQQLVASGELKYVMLGGGMGGGGFGGPGGGNSASSQVQTWVEQHCTAVSASAYGGSSSSSSGSSTTSSTSASGLYACTAGAASSSSSSSGSTA
ncbi:glycosyltransferase family 39 protein [Actinocrinis sp.]|uniref:glycosyltransferase family 39 protein n=1 Tax=Actinocrinis sp. TaxID=1920516 RepID=UPI002D6DC44B|nr:glycosyltransferase family 39 protein [Actinocrinis sp.]HZP53017.1 glycosyltransferase family 39 protein [Actinocrinis sp.]